jgi:hypothetical protein
MFTFFEQMINIVGKEAMGAFAENTRNALEGGDGRVAENGAAGWNVFDAEVLASLAFLLNCVGNCSSGPRLES